MKRKYSTIAHLLTGFVLVLKGYTKITDHYPFTGSIILGLGLIIFAFVAYERRLKKHNPKLQMIAHFFEGMALLFTTYVYIDEGKNYLPYATAAAAIVLFVTVFILYKKQKKNTLNLAAPEYDKQVAGPDSGNELPS